MLNVFLGFPCVPFGQVSLSWPLPPCPLLLTSISPSLLLPTCFLLFLHHSTPMYIHQQHFYTHPASFFCFIPTLSPYPPFRFLVFSMAIPLLPTLSHTITCSLELFSHIPLPLPGPSHSPAPTCPLYSPFCFFDTFYGYPHATRTIPHPYILTSIVFPMSPYPCLAHPIPLPLPTPPSPPISLFWAIYGFLLGTFMICSIELRTFDRFFGAISCQGKGNVLLSIVGNRPPKCIQIFMHALWCMVNVSHTAERQWGGPVVAYCNPQLTAGEAA